MNELMPAIMKAVHEKPILKEKLYQVNFHTTLSGEAMVTLIYHKKLGDNWKAAAEDLRASLSSLPSSTNGIVQILGRSRGQKLELTCSHVDEVLTVAGKQFSYRQVEGAFSQPNAGTQLPHTDLLHIACMLLCCHDDTLYKRSRNVY